MTAAERLIAGWRFLSESFG